MKWKKYDLLSSLNLLGAFQSGSAAQYKLFWIEDQYNSVGGVGIFVANKWLLKVINSKSKW